MCSCGGESRDSRGAGCLSLSLSLSRLRACVAEQWWWVERRVTAQDRQHQRRRRLWE